MTIANLTIRDIYYHPIIFNADTQSPLAHNVTLINAGQQLIKPNPHPSGGGIDNGIVQYSVIEYETTSKDSCTNGVDVHRGRNWTIRHNLFRKRHDRLGWSTPPARRRRRRRRGRARDPHAAIAAAESENREIGRRPSQASLPVC